MTHSESILMQSDLLLGFAGISKNKAQTQTLAAKGKQALKAAIALHDEETGYIASETTQSDAELLAELGL